MNDTKQRILTWREHKEDMQWTASASTGCYIIICWIRGTFSAFRTVTASNAPIGVPEHYTLDAAIAACESDYISRCTEFLKLAGPGECVVKVEDVAEVTDFVEGIWGDRELKNRQTYGEFPSKSIDRLTAAIDAARSGK